MKSKLMIALLTIGLLISMLTTNAFGDEVPQATVKQEMISDISSDDAQMANAESLEKRISATIVSNVPEGLELPHAHYSATPWISAVGMVMLTGTILVIVMTKYHKSHK